MIFGGIDPGKTGAIAFVEEAGGVVGIFDWGDSRAMSHLLVVDFVFIEKQQAYPKQGVRSMFNLGMNYGQWQGRMEALGVPFEIITPQKWRKGIFDSMPRSDDKKAMSLDMARRLFPGIASTHLARKMDHGRAEALLIAELCRRIKRRQPIFG